MAKKTLEETLKELNKKYGEGSVMSLNDKIKSNYDIISTGSIGFDYQSLGIGGFAKSKLYELVGWEGSGKSTVCGHLAAECQKNGGKVLYIDGEHALDKTYFQTLGVNTDEMLISQPSYGEEGFNTAIDIMSTGEIDLVIIDSDSSLIPKKVIDGEVGDSAIGLKARLNSTAYPKLKNVVMETNTCCVVVSQYREKIGVMFGDPRTTQGGHALKYYADVRIEIARSLVKEGQETVANATRIKTIKNKTFPPFNKCEFNIVYGLGIDKFGELLILLHDLELGKKWGQTYTYNGTKYDYNEFVDMLKEDVEFFDELKQKVINELKQ